MRVEEFDYEMPPELIAQTPIEPRDASRLMVVYREEKRIEHRVFSEIDSYLSPDDILVVNDTKVRRARIEGKKETGGEVEVLLLQPLNSFQNNKPLLWEALINCSKKPKIGSAIIFGPEFKAEVLKEKGEGIWEVKLFYSGDLENVLEQYGRTPLPPYIKRDGRKQEDQDQNWYQTIFARKIGAAAAPTAGLHFTERVIARLKEKGVELLTVTLHVGIGTFQPVRVEEVEKHKMHKEYYEITPETSQRLIKAKEEGKKIIACGTTTVRVLETWYYNHNLNGYTKLFIYPGYKFQVVGGMITNFHLPRSTLLMLVSAFAGKELIFCAYREAIEKKYRFYSYGDAMLIL